MRAVSLAGRSLSCLGLSDGRFDACRVVCVCVCVCSQRELALTDDAFQAAFGMTKDAFAVQPLWRRQNQKGKVGLH